MTWIPGSSHGVTMGIKYLIMPTAPGARANKVCVGGTWAGGGAHSATGVGNTSNELPVTSNYVPPKKNAPMGRFLKTDT